MSIDGEKFVEKGQKEKEKAAPDDWRLTQPLCKGNHRLVGVVVIVEFFFG